ncbi:hypothetical protein AB4084_19225, partial [Lysobacter sp. 2RAB21]
MTGLQSGAAGHLNLVLKWAASGYGHGSCAHNHSPYHPSSTFLRMSAKHSDAIAELRSNLIEYARLWPEEAEHTQPFLELLDEALQADRGPGGAAAGADGASQHAIAGAADPFMRERLAGHFTGGAW